MTDLRSLLADGQAHVLDGAMGTMLYAKGVFVNICYDELNSTRPELVQEVHERYVQAGAEILETNTFGANPVKLSSYGLEERTEELNRRAAEIALHAAKGRAAVAGAIGPLGIRLEPLGPTGLDEAEGFFGRQVDGLLQGGVDSFIIETFSDLREAERAFRAVKKRCDLPVIVLITIGEDCVTSLGATVEQAASAAEQWGADCVGLNCSVGPAVVLDGLERMAEVTELPLVALPNAGLPRAVGDRKMYLAGPEYMARYARRLIDAGARLVGGCCGTTPEHIRCIRQEVASAQSRRPVVRVTRTEADSKNAQPAIPLGERSDFGRRLATSEFVMAATLLPPKGWEMDDLLDDCRTLTAAGVSTIGVREERGTARMSVLAAAQQIMAVCKAQTVLHYTCRDRSLSDMTGDLLGAAAAGLHNVLLLTGDPPGGAPYPDFDSLVEVDAVGLTNVVNGLNRAVDHSGNSIGAPTGFVAGVGLSPGARNQSYELDRLAWKLDAGADFIVTQDIFDVEHLLEFLSRATANVPVLVGLRVLASARQAEFLRHEVPGVYVPERVVQRMRRAERDGAATAGLTIAQETAEALVGEVAGLYLSGEANHVAEVAKATVLSNGQLQP